MKGKILKDIAIIIDIFPALIATVCQFPIWIDRSSDATVSGVFLILAFFSVLPFIKQIKAYIKSPSVPVVWLVIFVLLALLRSIIDQMIIVSLIGLISNILGTVIYKIGERCERTSRNESDDGAEE